VVIGFTAVFATGLLPSQAIAHPVFGAERGQAFSGRHRSAPLAERCERLSRDPSKVASAMVTAYLDLDDVQEQALAPLLDVASRWREDSLTLCREVAAAEQHSVDLGLATMETFLSRSASAAGELRSAWSDFSATLSAEQQDTISEMISRHHRRG
ncbi:MAG: hypothetical protein AAGI15_07785, partial [Pseudomonadota bacterium]